jgi:hypothetical protein
MCESVITPGDRGEGSQGTDDEGTQESRAALELGCFNYYPVDSDWSAVYVLQVVEFQFPLGIGSGVLVRK